MTARGHTGALQNSNATADAVIPDRMHLQHGRDSCAVCKCKALNAASVANDQVDYQYVIETAINKNNSNMVRDSKKWQAEC